MVEITLIIAFVAGVASFLSPCVLPLVPAFIAYLSGTTAYELQGNKDKDQIKKAKVKVFINTLLFVLGFTFVFSILGAIVNGVIPMLAFVVREILSKVAGIVIILLGFIMLGAVKPDFLQKEHKIKLKGLKPGYPTSFAFGAAFAVGWTPCVGAILGAVFTLALTRPGIAFWMLFFYGLGLGVPFLLAGLFTAQATSLINKYQKQMRYVSIGSGIILIILGILVFTNQLSRFADFGLAGSLLG